MESATGPRGPGGGYRPVRPEALLRPPMPAAPDRVRTGAVPAEPLPGQPPHGPAVPPGPAGELPLLPGFRELATRRSHGSAQHVIAELAGRRQSAGLSQTQVAARMGTSQSAVARLESGGADVRVSTLERYAAAVGCQLSWQLHGSGPDLRGEPR